MVVQPRNSHFASKMPNALPRGLVQQKLRAVTHDATPNEVVTVPGPKMGRMQRAIFYYADFVGTLTGVGVLIAVIVAWLVIGPALQFNANWWLAAHRHLRGTQRPARRLRAAQYPAPGRPVRGPSV